MNIPKEFISVVTNSMIFSRNSEALSQFDPKKILALQRSVHQTEKEDELYPYAVEVHLTSRCQLSCINCSYTSRNKIKEDLSMDSVNEVHDFMRRKGAKSLIYSGGGDPLAWKGDIYKIFSKPEPFFRTIATNGVGLDRVLYPECIENIDIIQISLRGYNSEVFSNSSNSNPNLFNKIHENITKLIGFKNKVNKFPQLTAKIIVTKKNFLEVPALFEYCVNFGFDIIVVKLSGNFEEEQDVTLKEVEVDQLYKAVLNISENYKDYHYIDSIMIEPQKNYRIDECWAVELRTNMLVRPNGDVFLCIVSPNSDLNSIGNINESPVQKIWNSDKHIEIISKLSSDMKCGVCNLDICRLYRYNYYLQTVHELNSLVAATKAMDSPRLL